MSRPLRALARLVTALGLAVVLAGVPVAIVLGVGVPLPSLAGLRDAWSAQRVDADLVLRIGTLVFVALWAWFALTALAELWRVMAWKRGPVGARLAPVPPGPSGWIRSLVRFVAISSVTAGAVLSSVAGAVRPAAAAGHGPVARPAVAVALMSTEATASRNSGPVHFHVAAGRETPYSMASALGDPALRDRIIDLNIGRRAPDGGEWKGGVFPPGMEVLLPGEATVMTPFGPAHEVEPGDCYWDVADDHLTAVLEREPAPREVWDYTNELITFNSGLLGYDDPALVRPGDLVVLPAVEGAAITPAAPVEVEPVSPVVIAEPAPEVTAEPAPADADPAPVVTAQPTPSVPATSVPATSAAEDGPVVVVQEGGAVVPFLSGLGTATLLAAGGISVVEARRRRRLRTAEVGSRLAAPVPEHVQTERVLRSLGASERMARLDVALRAAAPSVASQGAVITAAVLGHAGDLRVLLRGAAAPVDPWWRLDLADDAWLLDAEIETTALAAAAGEGVHPCPGLVHLGVVADGDLFVDLEAVGVLAVDSPHATPILRAMAAALDISPFIEAARVRRRRRRPGREEARTDELESLDAALDAAAVTMGSTRALARGRSTFALRVGGVGGEAWEPALVVAAGSHDADALSAVAAAAQPSSGLGVAVEGVVPGRHGWTLRADGNEHVLQPLGLTVQPVGVSDADLAALHGLLAAQEAPLERVAPAVSLVRTDAAEPFVEPGWELLVRVFGQVEVVDRDGAPAPFERSKALELVAWLSQHRERPTRQAARTALWDLSVRDATFANVVSDARRAMARAVAPAEGEEWIARTLTEDLPLHEGVVSDAELVQRRVAHARGLRPLDAIETLRPAVDLLAGMPFAGTGYLWCDAEGLSSALSLLAVDAAGTMAEHCLTVGDTDGVFWATGQGLKVIGGHEALVELRMRAHARRGDLAGVRQEWESYERALAADTFLTPEPSAKMVNLRRELLAPSLAG